MFRLTSSSGGAAQTLWCVELVPKLKKLEDAEKKELLRLAKGMPADPKEALLWMVEVAEGLTDHREPRFLRVRQRLVVFRDKRQASARAKKKRNEFWSAHVREVRIL